MTDIRSAEDEAREVLTFVLHHGFSSIDAVVQRLTDLIRARDAKIRADERARLARAMSQDKSLQGLQRATFAAWLTRQGP